MIPGPEIHTEFFGIRLAFFLLRGEKPLYEIKNLAHGMSRVAGYGLRVEGCPAESGIPGLAAAIPVGKYKKRLKAVNIPFAFSLFR